MVWRCAADRAAGSASGAAAVRDARENGAVRPIAGDNPNRRAPDPGTASSRPPGARGWLTRLFGLLAVIAASGLFAPAAVSPAFADMPAQLDASSEKGYARLVFEFERLPDYSHSFASGIFVLSFGEPVDLDVTEVPEDIPSYVGQVRRDPDGRAVRFALNRSYRLNIMEAGNRLFVDLLPPEWQGLPPSLPQSVISELARKAREAQEKAANEARQREEAEPPYKLKIRVAQQPTFSRIVFDWNKFVTVNLARQGRTVTLGFGESVKADFSRLKTDTPMFLQDVETAATDAGMEVRLTIDEDVDVRGFREGVSYVVDLTGPDAASDAAAEAVAKTIDEAGSGGDSRVDLAANPREESEPETPDSPATVEITDTDPAGLPPDAFARTPAEPPEVNDATVAEKAAEPPPKRASRTGTPGEKELAAAASEHIPSAHGDTERAAAAPETGAEAEAPAPGDAGQGIELRAEASDKNLRIVFQSAEPVPTAFFRRGDSIWLVFETKARLDTAALRETLEDRVDDLQLMRTDRARILHFALRKPWLMHAAHTNNRWIINIGEMAGGETTDLQLVRALREDKRSMIRVALEGHGDVHWVTDPDVGDRLAIVTALPPQRGIGKPHEMVELSALPTAHGIVVRPRSDDVAVRPNLGEVLVTRHDGLTLSPGNASQYAPGRKPLRESARTGFIDFERWKEASPEKLSDRIYDYQRAIALAPEGDANARRFRLARFYLANGFHAEALGLLHRMATVEPEVESDPAFNAVRGAALALMGRTKKARKDFGVHALANDADAALWRGLLDVQDKAWNSALRAFHSGADVVGSYPPGMQARFRLAAARAALEMRRLDRAAEELEAVPGNGLPRAFEARARLLDGRYLEGVGRSEEARDAYDAVAEGPIEPAAAEARYRVTALDLKTGRISRKEAIEALQRLQLFWRGDDTELRTLRLLADLYVKEERYGEAFAVMNNSVKTFPESGIARRIQDDMKQVFQNLFLHGDSKSLPPVEALSLFYGYRELTPVGRLGDEMIRRLAGRLISVDLLDQAAELLDHQVYKRLKGAARAQVATRLAMVHLMNHKPELALRAIRRTRQAGLPGDLQRSRNLLEARALGELGRAATAVEILDAMEGEDVERLKADALWSAQDWQKAGKQLEKMFGGRWQEPEPLSESERFDVLRAAIAYSLAGDQFALDRLHTKFYSKLVKTPDADAFLLVTKPIREKGVAFRNLAKEVAATDTLDAFMKEFRARYDRSGDPSRRTSREETDGQG